MALSARDLSLFGLDLSSAFENWLAGWQEAAQWPVFAWLTPEQTVRVSLPDGALTLCKGTSFEEVSAQARTDLSAVVLPDHLVLSRRAVMPDLPWHALRQAVALEVGSGTPFGEDATAWGWQASRRGDGRYDVDIALASRQQVEQYLESVPELARPGGEVWARVDGRPVVVQGFGEARRKAAMKQGRLKLLGLCGILVVLMLAAVLLPFLQMRSRALEAQDAFVALQRETAQVVAARDALTRANDKVTAVKTVVQGKPDIPKLLETLAGLLPDDAYLTRFEVEGRHVKLTGMANNASGLMDALGAQAGFKDVKAPSPITRLPSANKESFTIEFNLAEEKAS